MKNSNITSTHEFEEAGNIFDIVAIDDAHYLLAAWGGLLKTTKDYLLKHYFKKKRVDSLCHVTDSLYLVGFYPGKLEVWNEQTE
jgi:hypothetical protein